MSSWRQWIVSANSMDDMSITMETKRNELSESKSQQNETTTGEKYEEVEEVKDDVEYSVVDEEENTPIVRDPRREKMASIADVECLQNRVKIM